MNQTIFCIKTDEVKEGGGLSIEIEGNAKDLINLFASVIDDNEEIEMVLMMAIMAVHAKRESESGVEGKLEELLMKMKPKAQA